MTTNPDCFKRARATSPEIARSIEDAVALRRLPIWSWYIRGARDMILRLREHLLCEEPHAGDTKKVSREDKIVNKAILDMIMYNKDNIDRFLMGQYEICLTDHEKDKKGRLVKCRAYFAKKIVTYKEVE